MSAIDDLIAELSRLPGIGRKTAQRLTFHLLQQPAERVSALARALTAVTERVRIFALAESLGGVASLISHPATMTHASVPAERKKEIGLGDGIVRLSCGVEDVDDLLADLEQALP